MGFSNGGELAMKISLFFLGVFAAIVCTEKSAEAEQNYPWCINKPDTPPQCRYTTLEQCLADRLGKGGSCSPNPYPSSPEPPNQIPEALRLAAITPAAWPHLPRSAAHRRERGNKNTWIAICGLRPTYFGVLPARSASVLTW
jgi:hypothetical protein